MILSYIRLAEITKTMEFKRVQMWYTVVSDVIFLKEEKDLHCVWTSYLWFVGKTDLATPTFTRKLSTIITACCLTFFFRLQDSVLPDGALVY